MLCIRPLNPRPGLEWGCGQCKPCRINQRRIWAARILLEAFSHALPSSFATLTYEENNAPTGGNLSKADWRSLVKGSGFRYFGCGEYGENTGRPHFHLIAFGTPPEVLSAYLEARWVGPKATLAPEPARRPLKGFIHVQEFVPEHASYVAGYVLKKMGATRAGDRVPEFARMSRRPGVGVPGLAPILRWLSTPAGAAYIEGNGDVPTYIGLSRRIYPLGRTLVQTLRDSMGVQRGTFQAWQRSEARRVARIPELEAPSRQRKRQGQYDRLKAKLNRISPLAI